MGETIKIYDTLKRDKVEIESIKEEQLSFYCCGPTVYGPAHIGNFRTFVVQDLFRRVVELSGVNTRHVRNITDVDDKTIKGSIAQGKTLSDFTSVWTIRFHKDCQALNLLPPHVEPSAVEHIPQQINLIEKLISKGLAYKSEDGSVYYRVSAFDAYGKLSHLDRREITSNQKQNIDADEYERETLSDFALWKSRKEEDGANFWQSPWGEGRPGWHIECSAMSMEYLGETFDVHSGGIDLCFPHHENEIAQSEGATGKIFSNYWFHITHLMVDGAKMSKSKGNLYTIEDIETHGFKAADLRYALLQAHYRKPLNFTWDLLKSAASSRRRIGEAIDKLKSIAGLELGFSYQDCLKQKPSKENLGESYLAFEALLDDLNTSLSFSSLFAVIKEIEAKDDFTKEEAKTKLMQVSFVINALGIEPELKLEKLIPKEVFDLAEQRWKAKQNKDFALADSIREKIEALGFNVKDKPGGYEVF